MAEAIRPAAIAVQPIRVRSISLPSLPAHVGIVLGLTTAGYALTLAGVSGLQSASEADLAAARSPIGATIDRAVAAHDRLADGLDEASRAYDAAAARYGDAADRLATIEAQLADLAATTKSVDGASRALPTKLALPPVVRSAGSAPRSTAHATSGGSAKP